MALSENGLINLDLIGTMPDELELYEVPSIQQKRQLRYNNILFYFMKSCEAIDATMAINFAEEQRIQSKKN